MRSRWTGAKVRGYKDMGYSFKKWVKIRLRLWFSKVSIRLGLGCCSCGVKKIGTRIDRHKAPSFMLALDRQMCIPVFPLSL